jgi:DNA-binding winged helix-turn-helix (wHTH) protein
MSSAVARRKFVFGEFELLPDRRLLRRNGQDVDLAAKAFDALVLLMRRSPGLVTKEELMSALWPNTAVSENSLSSQIWSLRKALGEGRWVENVPRRGYQFVGEFELLPDEPGDCSPVAPPPPPPPTSVEIPGLRKWSLPLAWATGGILTLGLIGYAWRSDRARSGTSPTGPIIGQHIRTVPFTAEGFAAEEEFVADAIAHTIRWRLEDATQSWPESRFLRWKHVLRTGRVRKEAGRIVVQVQLVDPEKRTLWSDNYSQPYPIAETVIGDVIGEHLIRLLEQGERRTSPGRQASDAVRDFSVKRDLHTPWRYGQVRDWTGIGFHHFSQAIRTSPDQECWSAGRSAPDHGFICRSTKNLELQTMVEPADAIFMTTGSQFTTLRWVAPADGRYSVRGRVWVADTVGRPCRVKLAHNTVDVLVERRNFAGFGSAIPIDFPGLSLTQGSAIDLIFGPESGIDYMSLDVQLTIRPVDAGL